MPHASEAACSEGTDLHDVDAVARRVTETAKALYPRSKTDYVEELFEKVRSMFEGANRSYRPMDTAYHDIEHTLQATLCWLCLFARRVEKRASPVCGVREFRLGLAAILMHDLGYLKDLADGQGTGAKYSFIHEIRSCAIAREALLEMGWNPQDVDAVRRLISCTGPRSLISAIPFSTTREKVTGQMVCTADYVGQMSDPGYISKLPALYVEFEESDEYRGLPQEHRSFKSFRSMLKGTPTFWKEVVTPKLEEECDGLFHLLRGDCSANRGPGYLDRAEANIERLAALPEDEVERLEQRADELRRSQMGTR